MSYLEYMNMDLTEMNHDELVKIQRQVLAEYDETMEKYAREVKMLDKPNFDPYSYFGEKKIRKIADKYSSDIADMEILLNSIDDELNKRLDAEDLLDYERDAENETKEDRANFLERESEKTEKIRRNNKVWKTPPTIIGGVFIIQIFIWLVAGER